MKTQVLSPYGLQRPVSVLHVWLIGFVLFNIRTASAQRQSSYTLYTPISGQMLNGESEYHSNESFGLS